MGLVLMTMVTAAAISACCASSWESAAVDVSGSGWLAAVAAPVARAGGPSAELPDAQQPKRSIPPEEIPPGERAATNASSFADAWAGAHGNRMGLRHRPSTDPDPCSQQNLLGTLPCCSRCTPTFMPCRELPHQQGST